MVYFEGGAKPLNLHINLDFLMIFNNFLINPETKLLILNKNLNPIHINKVK
jgi:hypothetical protein